MFHALLEPMLYFTVKIHLKEKITIDCVTKQGLVCPRCRKPNSDGRGLQQSKGLFAGCQIRLKRP